ncbi:MAG: AsmA family protein [Geminicoccaceae bacterium]
MKKLFLALGILLVLVVGAVVAVPFLVPTDTIKSQLTAEVEAATGRKLSVDGDLDLSVFPSLAVDMGDVRFANLPGSEVENMVSLKALQVELKPLPLLTGAVEIDEFVLVEPRIHLEVDADGNANWALETDGDAGEAATDQTSGGETGESESGLPITDLKLGDIRIEDGSLVFIDRTAGTEERVEAIDMKLSLADIKSPLNAKGSLDYKGETIELDVDLASPYDAIQGGSSAFDLGINSAPLQLSFDGELSNKGAPSTAGSIDLSVPSVKGLVAWLAEPLSLDTEALEALSIKGKLNGSADKIAFTDATIDLDKISGKGEVTADLAGSTPKVSGRLDLGMVDLNPYMPAAAAEDESADSEEAEAAAEGDADGATDWSDEPIELALGGVDLAFELTLEGLKAEEVKLGRTVLALNMAGQKLVADLKEFALYDGQGQGRLVVDTSSGQPAVEKQFTLTGLQALPFLTDSVEFERLEGTANADFRINATGGTERQLVESLAGEGKVTFEDGAIVGINLAAMVRNVGTAFLSAEANETRKTDFAELGGSFTIEKGILTNDDLLLQAPALRVGGAGIVDLPKRFVDYRIDPKAAATLEGQEGQSDVAGVLVPVVITGPFDDLSYKPDLGNLVEQAIKDPDALKENVKQQLDVLGDQTKDVNSVKDVKKALKNVGKEDGKKLLDALTKGDEDVGDSPAGGLLKGILKN